MITRKELIDKYFKFFESKKHKIIPSASLVPENDPTVLFTTAGMHPLIPFLLGLKHPEGKRLCGVQKCIRTQDIEEVGDEVHHTFFEMLGNWSLGNYFKKQAIEFSFEFLTKVLKIPVQKLAISCFKGDKDSPKDSEAAEIWKSVGISEKRIVFLPKKDNWWGPAGETGPCGPDTEMFYWKSKSKPPEKFEPKNKNWVEIWNDVFMQYNKNEKGKYTELKQKNVDTGMGVERTLTVLNDLDDNYKTELFFLLIKIIENSSGKKYEQDKETTKAMRIIADHIKASVFILGDNKKISPSNIGQGYVLRRLIRRAIRHSKNLSINDAESMTKIAKEVIKTYSSDYKELKNNQNFIIDELKKEREKFNKTLDNGLRLFKKITEKKKKISGKESFLLYQSYGFPLEMTIELAKENNVRVDEKEFAKELEKHQELSRTASKGKFKAGLSDNIEETKKLHTATHLLLVGLKKVLNDKTIEQRGSNITSERLRFDFSFERKLTEEEIKKIEDFVNSVIDKKIHVVCEYMSLKKAKESGAQGIFDSKYGEKVSVYTIGDFSKEICSGPHAENTGDLGKFKIIKEESSSLGVRRIKAVLEG
ncbi:MAG: alanine--tRNA ligase [Nanoarchaeota archaeon]|nr:alanine--tRNA ligase [Nanoarchaeota archaeon]